LPKARTNRGKHADSAKLNILRERLEGARRDAEAQLERLGCAKDAWRVIKRVFFDESETVRIEKRADKAGWDLFLAGARGRSGRLSYPYVIVDRAWFGPGKAGAFHLWLKVHVVNGTQALGPPERVVRPSRKLPSVKKEMLARMDDEDRRRLRLKRTSWSELSETWLHAERAAVATAALKRLHDPLATLAVGLFFGWSYFAGNLCQYRDDYASRVALDQYQKDGGQKPDNFEQAHELVKEAALPLLRKGRGPDTVAARLFRNEKLQEAIRAARGKPYSFTTLRREVRKVSCS
jgi:hypothetical protein